MATKITKEMEEQMEKIDDQDFQQALIEAKTNDENYLANRDILESTVRCGVLYSRHKFDTLTGRTEPVRYIHPKHAESQKE